MTSNQIRQAFLDFFNEKGHKILPSAPMVVRNDPTLMFTNAGMNQFKDFFLGNSNPQYERVANSQKCLRVSGKHNDLEEVGHDTYHHTMFEMLGNWSFGDYFKPEAIELAWEFLTQQLSINKDCLYATVFEGSKDDGLEADQEAKKIWQKYLPEERILFGNKKDNFWEMGETGPCGPCSEIHIDLRPEEEKKKVSGSELVNKDHPLVIEIWNLVFIQFNRKTDLSLQALPNKHVDTGMGFERLCMAVQKKKSNYDTDIFRRIINEISTVCDLKYGEEKETDIAMRVVADHLRAVAFSITDGQLPSNNKAGYVIRRILRRAIRYAYTFLGQDKPFICLLVNSLVEKMGDSYPELKSQQELIEKVIKEEEQAFLRTLDKGISMLEDLAVNAKSAGMNSISGKDAFVLYDTYGFPYDLTRLILHEKDMNVSEDEFNTEMKKQKSRSRKDAEQETEDWIELNPEKDSKFVGYDTLETTVKILKYRKIKIKNKELIQLVFDHTPFYPESGGQVGDKGYIDNGSDKVHILNTTKENELIVHIAEKLPAKPYTEFRAVVSSGLRVNTANNHTATHLLHYALRKVLGDHVEQKGSLVHPDYLRFDFSHFQKPDEKEIREIEKIVNQKIRDNIKLEEKRDLSMNEAANMGAIALFGEKYGEKVRVIRFGDSIELCGGTHVRATGQIGFFKITKETAIAAGIRRIEAITGEKFQQFFFDQTDTMKEIGELVPKSKNLKDSVKKILDENASIHKKLEELEKEKMKDVKNDLKKSIIKTGDINFIGEKINITNAADLRDLSFQLKGEAENLFLILGAEINGKANLSVLISDSLIEKKKLNAAELIKDFAKEIMGGGGGQPFFATAGGKNPQGIEKAIQKAKNFVENL